MLERLLNASRAGFISDNTRYRIIRCIELLNKEGPQPMQRRNAWSMVNMFCNIKAVVNGNNIVDIQMQPLSLIQSIAYDIVNGRNESIIKQILMETVLINELQKSMTIRLLNGRGIYMIDGMLFACTQIQRKNILQYGHSLPIDVQIEFLANFDASICINNTIDEIRQATLNMLELVGYDPKLIQLLPYVAWWLVIGCVREETPIHGLPGWLIESLL